MTSGRSTASLLAIELGGLLGPAWIVQRAAMRRARRQPAPLLRVVNLHGTPARHATRLRGHLEWLAASFDVLDPDELAALWQPEPDRLRRSRKGIWTILTFDDGLASNAEVAAPLLDALGLRAIFFVVPAFARLSGDAARTYYYRHVQPRDQIPSDVGDEDWTPMTPAQIRDLAGRHQIGNHTLSHSRLNAVPEQEVAREIVEGRRQLAGWTGTPIDAFAWTFAASAIDAKGLRLAAANHRFVFSPCPGMTNPDLDRPTLIWRVNVEAGWSRAAWRFMLSGLGDPRWQAMRRSLRLMAAQDSP